MRSSASPSPRCVRRYCDVKRARVTIEAARATGRLSVPFEPLEWLAEHKERLVKDLDRLADAVHHGRIPGGTTENGELRIGRPASAMPEDVDELMLDLYRRLPKVRITNTLLKVDAATGFTDAFTHLRTSAPCKYRTALLKVILVEGLNLALSKMAEASNTHDFFRPSRLSRWHIESEAIDRALGHGDRGASKNCPWPASGAWALPPGGSSMPRVKAKR